MTLQEILPKIYEFVLQPIIFLLFGIAFIIFIWGIVEFLRDSDSEDGRKKGWANITWGLIGMVIMIGVFGIINIIAGTLGIDVPDEIDDLGDTMGDIDPGNPDVIEIFQ